MDRKNLYSADTFRESLRRVDTLSAGSQPLWGRMTVAQMQAHCAEIIEVSNGKPLKSTPLLARLLKGMIRRMVLGDKPFPKNSRTHPQYLMSSDLDFDSERERLHSALSTFLSEKDLPRKHPLFGVLDSEEKGAAMYKHLNHHLEQFGV